MLIKEKTVEEKDRRASQTTAGEKSAGVYGRDKVLRAEFLSEGNTGTSLRDTAA